MTNEEIRIAVAECCGWIKQKRNSIFGNWRNPSGHWDELPHYESDLNAMAEAEEALTCDDPIQLHGERGQFLVELSRVIGLPDDCSCRSICDACCHATARQRAEAFLRTMGKWKE